MFNYNQIKAKNTSNVPDNRLATMDINYPTPRTQPLSLLHEKDIEYEDTVYYLNINSGDRTTNYPQQYDYSLKLSHVYNNVRKVEMISAIFPNSSGIITEPYLVIDIEELNTIDFTTQDTSHKGFAICPLKNPNQASGGYVLIDMSCAGHTTTVFKTPMSISRLQIKIRDSTGEIYPFAQTAPAGSTAKEDQHSFVLKITTLDKSRKELQNRNTY
jgi:hypothetical protein